jgi:hypothetical protein
MVSGLLSLVIPSSPETENRSGNGERTEQPKRNGNGKSVIYREFRCLSGLVFRSLPLPDRFADTVVPKKMLTPFANL